MAASSRRTFSTGVEAGTMSAIVRRDAGRRLRFSIGLFIKVELGIVTRLPAVVRILVDRKPTSSTVPS